MSAAIQHRDVAVCFYFLLTCRFNQNQVLSETVTEVQNTLDNERMTYRKKEENWRHEISMLTASKNSAESTVTELQRQIRDLTDRSSAAHQDLETTTNELANLKAHTQVILQEHLRLESL